MIYYILYTIYYILYTIYYILYTLYLTQHFRPKYTLIWPFFEQILNMFLLSSGCYRHILLGHITFRMFHTTFVDHIDTLLHIPKSWPFITHHFRPKYTRIWAFLEKISNMFLLSSGCYRHILLGHITFIMSHTTFVDHIDTLLHILIKLTLDHSSLLSKIYSNLSHFWEIWRMFLLSKGAYRHASWNNLTKETVR